MFQKKTEGILRQIDRRAAGYFEAGSPSFAAKKIERQTAALLGFEWADRCDCEGRKGNSSKQLFFFSIIGYTEKRRIAQEERHGYQHHFI